MNSTSRPLAEDRHQRFVVDGMTPTFNELISRSNRNLRLACSAFVVLLVAGAIAAFLNSGESASIAYGIIVSGAVIPTWLWVYRIRRQLPLVPVVAFHTLLWNGLPLVINNPSISGYNESAIISASVETFVYMATLSIVYAVINSRPPSSPSIYHSFKSGGSKRIRGYRAFFIGLMIAAFAVDTAEFTGLIWGLIRILPQGSYIVFHTFLAIAKMSSTLALAFMAGARQLSPIQLGIFLATWTAMLIFCIASLLLSGALGIIAAMICGLYLGSGRIPWRFMTCILVLMAFLSLSKSEMRGRYWNASGPQLTLTRLPSYFSEWSELSAARLLDNFEVDNNLLPARNERSQNLFQRISLLQMTLYVQDKVQVDGIPPLGGTTYAVIPSLLIPRVLWKDKPRTHEGQVMLNVHFRRQSASETKVTYIAWGLLAEAYGNFGSLLGPAMLGLFFGSILSSFERWVSRFPIASLEGLLGCSVFLCILSSFEMTAAILVTSLFQSLAAIFIATFPFVRRTRLNRPT